MVMPAGKAVAPAAVLAGSAASSGAAVVVAGAVVVVAMAAANLLKMALIRLHEVLKLDNPRAEKEKERLPRQIQARETRVSGPEVFPTRAGTGRKVG